MGLPGHTRKKAAVKKPAKRFEDRGEVKPSILAATIKALLGGKLEVRAH